MPHTPGSGRPRQKGQKRKDAPIVGATPVRAPLIRNKSLFQLSPAEREQGKLVINSFFVPGVPREAYKIFGFVPRDVSILRAQPPLGAMQDLLGAEGQQALRRLLAAAESKPIPHAQSIVLRLHESRALGKLPDLEKIADELGVQTNLVRDFWLVMNR